MKKISLILIACLAFTSYTNAQIKLKKKAEKKANQVIDDFLFGKKKKNDDDNSSSNPDTNDSSDSGGEIDNYTPEEVDFGTLDFGKSIHFNVLINMLPELTQGFIRNGKPEGARYSANGVSFSTGIKNYKKGDREMTITLNDYLGAETYASAQSAGQFEYESTDGYAKSIEVDGIPGWLNFENDSGEGTLMLYLNDRFYATVNAEQTNESELKAIASDIRLIRLKSK